MSKKNNKKAKAKAAITRKGVILVALLAAMILVVSIVTFSYSWFEPQTVSGKGLSFQEDSRLRSEDCSFVTHQGEVVTAAMKTSDPDTYKTYFIDQVRYFDATVTGSVSVPAKVGDTPGRVYFKTDITNGIGSFSHTDGQYPSIVSLYISTMPGNLTVACTYPSNSVRFVSSQQYDYYIIRNAYVKVRDDEDVDGPGLLEVEWFVENNTNSAIPINLNNLYLMYN